MKHLELYEQHSDENPIDFFFSISKPEDNKYSTWTEDREYKFVKEWNSSHKNKIKRVEGSMDITEALSDTNHQISLTITFENDYAILMKHDLMGTKIDVKTPDGFEGHHPNAKMKEYLKEDGSILSVASKLAEELFDSNYFF